MKNIWPVGIIAFFVCFIGFTVGIVVWSTHHTEDLVSEKYYNDELHYQQRIDATQLARNEGTVPKIAYDAASRKIELHFPAPDALKSATGTVTLYRPSEAALDKSCALNADAAGLQQIAAADLKTGLWRVKAEWTKSGKAYFAEESVMVQ